MTIVLAGVTDWPGFSRAVRALRAEGVAPEDVRWRLGDAPADDLFGDATALARDASALPDAPAMRLPKWFVEAARSVFLNIDASRLPLLHRMALRIADDARSWDDPLHADRLRFDKLLREVRHEIHKMHAFVRFRQIEMPPSIDEADDPPARIVGEAGARSSTRMSAGAGVADGSATGLGDDADADALGSAGAVATAATATEPSSSTRHVAWFEPTHHILEAAAPFFARRFATMRWAIMTPRASVDWDGRAMRFGPGASREDAPAADAGEALWLAYYRSIFNPARVKVAMMKREMPVRFWKNLPEASAIGDLLAEAPRRRDAMIAAGGALRERRRGQVDRLSPGAARHDEGGATGAPATIDLPALSRLASRCRDCPVADVATQTVFGEGSATARLMLVGEQPGDQEDLRGRPFQGPAGQLLHAALAELGWDARELYLTNAVKHFHHELRGKRRLHKTPGQQEAAACLHWLEAEIAALAPRAIVALGATAARSLLGRDVGLLANEGQWFARDDGVPVLVCLHPAAILRAEPSRQPALRARWVETLARAGEFAKASGPVA